MTNYQYLAYWTKQYDEGLSLINEIIDDDEFVNSKARIEKKQTIHVRCYVVALQIIKYI